MFNNHRSFLFSILPSNESAILKRKDWEKNPFKNSSKTPDLVNPSNWSLFTSLISTLLIKSKKDLNSPLFSLSFIIFVMASKPTFLIAPRP